MCRWLAYSGPPIYLGRLVLQPENSLIDQSRRALESVSTTNADGFGIGWYGGKPEPGCFRDTLPAWSDQNLLNLCEQIQSGLFFAHVRAATGTDTTRANCHPFHYGRWMFMHNGMIGEFERVCRDLTLMVAPRLFPRIEGTTDSEVLFYLLITNGLEDDPGEALRRTVGQVNGVMTAAGIAAPLRITLAISDGQSIHALRYASDQQAPSLYYGCGPSPRSSAGEVAAETANSVLILSEPLDHAEEQWVAVPQNHLLIAGEGGIAVLPFEPEGWTGTAGGSAA